MKPLLARQIKYIEKDLRKHADNLIGHYVNKHEEELKTNKQYQALLVRRQKIADQARAMDRQLEIMQGPCSWQMRQNIKLQLDAQVEKAMRRILFSDSKDVLVMLDEVKNNLSNLKITFKKEDN